MNYYNEFDPKAASWLRELIASQVLLGSSASDPARRGKLDTEPKPFQATCNFERCATGRSVHAQAYALRRERAPHRKIHTPSVRSGWFSESESSCFQEAVFLWRVADTGTPVLGYASATHEQSSPPERVGKRRNTSTSDFGQAELETKRRTFCKCGMLLGWVGASSERPPRISAHKIESLFAGTNTQPRSGRTPEFSFENNDIFYAKVNKEMELLQ